jgi:carbon monoxide dehydrogenase subunit G
LKVKVGAVQVVYQGTAHLVDVDEEGETSATATIEAEGREVGGQGSVRATMALTVALTDTGGSEVRVESDLTVAGRIAHFGRAAIEDVSRRLMVEMGHGISTQLQAASAR